MRLGSSNTCRRTVGRLLEVCVTGYRTLADAAAMAEMMRDALTSLPAGERVIIVGDWRHCTVLNQGIAARVTGMLADANPRALRSGILHSAASPTAVLQMMRLISEANFPGRRVFTDVEEQLTWLGEVTTSEEFQRVQAFLGV